MRSWVSASKDPWGNNQELFDWIRSTAEKMRSEQPSAKAEDSEQWNEYYRERDAAAWYFREMAIHLDMAERNAEKGDVRWAMWGALKLGALYGEAMVKWAHEGKVLPLLEVNERQREAAAAKRLMTDEARATIVQEILDERGKGVRDALRVAAKRHPEGGKEGTYRIAFYGQKKSV